MTRTRRIYNKLTMKKTLRNDISKPEGGKWWDEMTPEEKKEYIMNPLRNSVQKRGFIYHPYASGLCMGHCPFCRDRNKDQKHLRKLKKAEFRNQLREEL